MLRRLYSSVTSRVTRALLTQTTSASASSSSSSSSSSSGSRSSSPSSASRTSTSPETLASRPRGRTRVARARPAPQPSSSSQLALRHLVHPSASLPPSTRGRKRRTFTLSPSLLSTSSPSPSFGFEAIRPAPVPLALHLAFNPPHLPLPLNLGTSLYTVAPSLPAPLHPSSAHFNPSHISIDELFTSPATPNASSNPFSEPGADPADADTAVNEHTFIQAVLEDISSASKPTASPSEPLAFARIIGDAQAKWGYAGSELDALFTRLQAGPAPRAPRAPTTGGNLPVEPEIETRSDAAALDGAVADLVTLLARIPASNVALGGEIELATNEGVIMDSVKRKRKKKINKHKYKKRRKATRAERKRLGK